MGFTKHIDSATRFCDKGSANNDSIQLENTVRADERFRNALAFTGIVCSVGADCFCSEGIVGISRRSAIESLLQSGLCPEIIKLRQQPAAEIASQIARLRYAEFLQTPYWQTIRRAVAALHGNHCERCNKPTDGNVHHLSYQHHGMEHLYLEDLEFVCGTCHASTHGVPTGFKYDVLKVLNSIGVKYQEAANA